MSEQSPLPADEPEKPVGWLQKRRARVVEEIDRNRRGEYKVPTWVLVVALAVVVVAWASVIAFA